MRVCACVFRLFSSTLSFSFDDNRLIDRLHASCHFRSHKNILSSIPVLFFFSGAFVSTECRLQHHLLCTYSGKWVQFWCRTQFTFFCWIFVLWFVIQIYILDIDMAFQHFSPGVLPKIRANRNKFQTNVKWCTTNGFGLWYVYVYVCVYVSLWVIAIYILTKPIVQMCG